MTIYKNQFHSSFEAVDMNVIEALRKIRERLNFLKGSTVFKLNFMMRELLNNAVEHGNQFQVEKWVSFEVKYEDPLLIFYFKDEGSGIDPDVISCNHIGTQDIRDEKFMEAYFQIEANVIIESIKFAKEMSFDNAIALRHRGFETIKLLNFDLEVEDSKLKCTLDLSKEV